MDKLSSWISPCLAGILFFVYTATGLEISTKSEIHTTSKGSDITLNCETSGGVYDAWNNSMTWTKMNVINGVETKSFVNSGNRLLDPFSNTGRYRYQVVQSAPVTSSIIISGAEIEDSGEYVCKLFLHDDQLDEVLHTVEITAHIDDIRFMSTSEDKVPELTFKFDDVSKANLTCSVLGGNPKPVVDIYVGDDVVTDQFKVERKDETSGDPGLQKMYHHVILTAEDFQVESTNHGNHITCKAEIIDAPSLNKEISAKIEVRFGPTFEGCRSQMESDLGQENYEISCTVRANPPVDRSTVMWEFIENGESVNLTHGKEHPVYKTSTVEMDDEYEVTFRLQITVVNETNLQTYTLRVANDVAMNEHAILLYERTTTKDPPTKKPEYVLDVDPNSSSSLRYALGSFVTIILTYIFTQI